MCNANQLVMAYKGGTELFQERVISIIRPIMISEVENYSSCSYEDFVKNLNYNSLNISNNVGGVSEILENVVTKLTEFSKENKLYKSVPYKYEDGEIIEEHGGLIDKDSALIEHGAAAYRTLSSILAIATDIISPELELLIVFLPDIFKMVNILVGNTEENRLSEVMQNQIIPQIIKNIRSQLDKILSEADDFIENNISTNVEEMLNLENQALTIAKNRKKDKEQEFKESIDSLDQDIAKIRE